MIIDINDNILIYGIYNFEGLSNFKDKKNSTQGQSFGKPQRLYNYLKRYKLLRSGWSIVY